MSNRDQDVAGLPDEENNQEPYADLFREYLKQSGLKISETDEEAKPQDIEAVRIGVANEILSIDELTREYEAEGIFDAENAQKQYDDLIAEGLRSLRPEQIQKVLAFMRMKNRIPELMRSFYVLRREKIKEAKEKKDLSLYLMWYSQQPDTAYINYVMMTNNCFDFDQLFKLILADIEEKRSRFATEAKHVRKMYHTMNSIPRDSSKPRIALGRLPKELDHMRPVWVLIEYPEGSYLSPYDEYLDRETGKIIGKPENKRKIFLSSHPNGCSSHAYDDLYKATRIPKGKDSFESRPFYIAAYEAIDPPEGFPDSAKNILEISFQSGNIIPNTRARIKESYPDIQYAKKPYISQDDYSQSIKHQNGVAHYAVQNENNGPVTKQDLVPYAMMSIRSGQHSIPDLEDFLNE